MAYTPTKINDVILIEPNVFADDRGYFFESFNQEKFQQATGISVNFVQDNESKSTRGVLRGLHYQLPPHAQAKLVRVVHGEVLDIAVDIRKNSPTYGQYVACLLSQENKKQLFIPRGFAHGFVVLSPEAVFQYKCDNYYNKPSEGGIIYNDKTINIDWQIETDLVQLSDKDKILPTLENAINTFEY